MSAARTAVAALLLGSPVLAACAEGDGGDRTVAVYEYGDTADGVELHQVGVTPPDPGLVDDGFESEAFAAVDALLRHRPTRGHRSLWNGECAPGEHVARIRMTEQQTTLWLTGSGGADCRLTEEASAIRDQQLVWTVLVNSKASGWRFAPVVVHDGSGATWEPIVADDAYLPPFRDY